MAPVRAILVLIPCLLLATGCGDGKERIAFDEISRLPPKEELVEIEVGHFIIPVSLKAPENSPNPNLKTPIQLQFDLVAIVPPEKVDRVTYLMDRHRGKIRNEVIRVCRTTSRKDLLESEWSTVKAHLLDAIQPLMGGRAIRRLATPTISRDEL